MKKIFYLLFAFVITSATFAQKATDNFAGKYKTDDGKHIVIRPLAYCKEADIETYSEEQKFPIIPCNLCGSQDGLQRVIVKKMLAQWDKEFPGRVESIYNAMQNIHPSHMLDRNIFDFHSLVSEQMKANGVGKNEFNV